MPSPADTLTSDEPVGPQLATPPAISIQDLRIDYGSHLAVDNMSVDIERGVIYGLVGPNGAGKTSTFKALASLLKPTLGKIYLNGHDIVTHQRLAQANIGYMPDMAPVASDLKVWEFLDMFAGAHGLSGKEKSTRIDECIALVDLHSEYHAMCTSLSRGMMQRLVLAKTLLHRPSLLILDEPASGMDIKSRVGLRNILRNICKSHGATVLISSHILPELTEMCDEIGILHKGHLLDSGPVHDVLHRMTGLLPEIKIRLAEPPDMHWKEWLLAQEYVSNILGEDATHFSFHFEGEESDLAELLRRMITQGYLACRVSERQRSLEEILLDLEYDGH
ncbi:ABC transporter ATP-binding protein [Rubritalea tangerina]|uniref:ABC transporter ATP-binding protein n=1 Tax=Rubritalea tangerina TaxID=430798 RepID=A0ABW4Z8A4_9BACT